MPETFYLHVGTRKSGTTTLQSITRASEEQLLAAGLGFPFGVPTGTNRRPFMSLMRKLGGDPAKRPAAVERLRASVAATSQKRAMFSAEGLAALPADVIATLAEALQDTDLHIIVTVRDLARQLPSEWQQSSKLGEVPGYLEFCDQVVDPASELSELFLARYDAADIAARWGAAVGPDRVHLIVLPQQRGDENWLPRTFFGLMDVGMDSLKFSDVARNTSMGYAEAELLRRTVAGFNARETYQPYEIHLLVRKEWKPTEAGAGDKIGVPQAALDWCRARAERQIEEIKAGGWQVIGDLEDLRPNPSTPVFTERDSRDAELAVAMEQLGRFMTRDLDRNRKQRRRAAQEKPGTYQRLRARAGRLKRMTLARLRHSLGKRPERT